MSIELIFDDLTLAGLPTPSNEFINADFIVFSTPLLLPNEGYEISMSVVVVLPALGERTLYEAITDTKDAVKIPRELGRTGLTLKVYLATPYQVPIQMYVVMGEDNNSTAQYEQSFNNDDLINSQITINHGRGKLFPIVQLYDGNNVVTNRATVTSIDENSILLNFSSQLETIPILGTYTVKIS